MSIETVAVSISLAVLVLQIIQMMRYVKLESEVNRIATELEQTLSRLQYARELTRGIFEDLIRYYRFYGPILKEINGDGKAKFWRDQARYEHASAEAEIFAKLNSNVIELRAIAGAAHDMELGQLVEQINGWINNPQEYGDIPLGEFITLIGQTHEMVLRLIDRRLSIKN